MKTKLTKIIAIVLAVFGLATASLAPLILSSPTYADDDICNRKDIPQSVKDAYGQCTNSNSGSENDFRDAITNIINGIIAVLGVVAVVVIVIGGVLYMTSAGDPGKVKRAKDTILYAAIGLIICVLSFAIVNFVIKGIIEAPNNSGSSIQSSSSSK
ncbi:hypothetical protein IJJ39_01845 [Candidatus Saccharibacteria bacterium]|nr:hypothetical protein [Candidatus Saccharibacteria bacterium]